MPPFIFTLLFALVALPVWANEGSEEATKANEKACAALAEDAKRDESKLTEEAKQKHLDNCPQFGAVPLKKLEATKSDEATSAEESGKGKTANQASNTPDVQGFDLDPATEAQMAERTEAIERQARQDARITEWGRNQQERWAGMTTEERQRDIEMQRRTLGGQARMERLGQLVQAETQINESAKSAMYANQAAAVADYEVLANKANLTAEEQIGKQTLAAMAGEHAGRTARESGFESDATKQALQNDPIFAEAFQQGKKEPLEQAGVGGFFGQFQTAEPRQLENHERGECGRAIGNVPALPCGDITSGFGARNIAWSPWHNGQDTRAARGAAIMGSAVGRVVDVKPEGPGRVSVHVDHGNNFVTVHRHVAADSALPVGSHVDTNTQIGAVETAGTGPHKHTEIFFEGKALNTNNYNQLAYVDRCTVGCPENTEQPQIASAERLITAPNQATRLDGSTDNGENPSTMYAGGLRRGSTQVAQDGSITLRGGQRYTPGQGGMGDGGYADTAPMMSQPFSQPLGAPTQGGVQQGSQSLGQNGALPQGLANLPQLAQNTLTNQIATKELTPEQCRQEFEGKPAADILKKPECVKVLFPGLAQNP
jgi:murein DD-endopeptidase MepM/ murein hydrolase activator NlpD